MKNVYLNNANANSRAMTVQQIVFDDKFRQMNSSMGQSNNNLSTNAGVSVQRTPPRLDKSPELNSDLPSTFAIDKSYDKNRSVAIKEAKEEFEQDSYLVKNKYHSRDRSYDNNLL